MSKHLFILHTEDGVDSAWKLDPTPAGVQKIREQIERPARVYWGTEEDSTSTGVEITPTAFGWDDRRLDRATARALLRWLAASEDPDARARTPTVDHLVRYDHPAWGACLGRVLRTDGKPGYVLVQDLASNGAREWWPAGECEVER